jgi:hypothetical protein
MLFANLIIVNLPVYLLIGWLVFDDRGSATESFWETIVMVLKHAFVPSIVRDMIWEGEDDHDPGHAFKVIGFFATCIAVTAGEWYALTTWVWPMN